MVSLTESKNKLSLNYSDHNKNVHNKSFKSLCTTPNTNEGLKIPLKAETSSLKDDQNVE